LNLNASGDTESRDPIPSPQVKHRNIGRYVLHPGLVLLYALLSSQFDKLNSTVSISLLQWSQLLFFIFGIVFAFSKDHLPLIQKHSKWTFPVSIVIFAVYLMLVSAGFTGGYLSVLRAIGAWYLIYSLIGMASKRCTQPSPILRYLSQASMAIYILHLPLQIIIGYFLLPLSFNPIVKMVVLTLLVFTLSFGLYEGIKRTKLPLLLLCFGITPPKPK
jgi:peptidoglycan/LPS O-acetylase OafA/YrhL